LSTSDRVVTTGFANLSDGAKVVVGKDEAAPTADLAPRKKRGSRDVQAREGQGKEGQGKDWKNREGQGKEGERRGRRGERGQGEGGPGPAPVSASESPANSAKAQQ
jgi:multidrug efflux system membrane fusion protein